MVCIATLMVHRATLLQTVISVAFVASVNSSVGDYRKSVGTDQLSVYVYCVATSWKCCK